MKHFNFPTIIKGLVVAAILMTPGAVSAQIGGIGTINGNGSNVTVFPLPFGSEINIQGLQSPTAEVHVQFYTMQGVLFQTERIPHQYLLNVRTSTIPPGTYQMVVKDENMDQIFTKKVLKTQASTRH